MRKILTLVVFLSVLSISLMVYANSPSDIKITFDQKTKMLEAVIAHNTSDPINHYVKKVAVGLNGENIIEHIISKEDNNQNQTVSYLIPDVKDGDVISVEGYCSINGQLKKEITVKMEK
ncbi:MAG: hypothetical protein ABII25_05700 [bacterium]